MNLKSSLFVSRRSAVSGHAVPALSCALGILLTTALSGIAHAQVVVTAGVTETYDDNIFLESGDELPPVSIPSGQPGVPDTVTPLPEDFDGEKNDDFLTEVRFGLSGAPTLSRGIDTTMGANVGGIFFADQSDFDRLILNSDLTFHSNKDLIPQPFFINVDNLIRSQSNDATVAQGTATRLTQILYSNLELGARGVQLAPRVTWGAGYRLGYTSDLGDFQLKDRSDISETLEDRVEPEGSDYVTNSVTTTFEHQTTKRLLLALNAAYNIISFTNVGSTAGFERDRGELDRTEFIPSVSARYQLSEDFTLDGSAGYNFTRFDEEVSGRSVEFDENGNPLVVSDTRSDQQDSFIFGAGIGYMPDAATQFHVGVNQSTTPDVDGDRLTTRSVNLTGTESFTDRLRGTVSGRFLQYDVSDTLSDATERFELLLALQYNITPSIALNTGWNFADQNEDQPDGILVTPRDYTSNRFFVGLSAGFLGILQ